MTEAVWPTKPEVFTVWLFPEDIADPCLENLLIEET